MALFSAFTIGQTKWKPDRRMGRHADESFASALIDQNRISGPAWFQRQPKGSLSGNVAEDIESCIIPPVVLCSLAPTQRPANSLGQSSTRVPGQLQLDCSMHLEIGFSIRTATFLRWPLLALSTL